MNGEKFVAGLLRESLFGFGFCVCLMDKAGIVNAKCNANVQLKANSSIHARSCAGWLFNYQLFSSKLD